MTKRERGILCIFSAGKESDHQGIGQTLFRLLKNVSWRIVNMGKALPLDEIKKLQAPFCSSESGGSNDKRERPSRPDREGIVVKSFETKENASTLPTNCYYRRTQTSMERGTPSPR